MHLLPTSASGCSLICNSPSLSKTSLGVAMWRKPLGEAGKEPSPFATDLVPKAPVERFREAGMGEPCCRAWRRRPAAACPGAGAGPGCRGACGPPAWGGGRRRNLRAGLGFPAGRQRGTRPGGSGSGAAAAERRALRAGGGFGAAASGAGERRGPGGCHGDGCCGDGGAAASAPLGCEARVLPSVRGASGPAAGAARGACRGTVPVRSAGPGKGGWRGARHFGG